MRPDLDSRGERILLALFGDRADAAGELTRSAPEGSWRPGQPLPRVETRARQLDPAIWGAAA